MYSGFMNHAVPLWVSYVNKRSTNVSHLVNTQNAIMTTSSATPPLSTTSVTTVNGCLCACPSELNQDDVAKLNSKLSLIKKRLYLETKYLSKIQQRLISASDNRISSRCIGAVGIATLVVTGMAIVVPDIVKLCAWFPHKIKNF